MRRPFLVTPAAIASLAAALLAATGCATPLQERVDRRLPGLPVVAPRGDRGPVHLQRLVSVGAGRVILIERIASDGRPPSLWRVTLDRRGTVLARTALPAATPLPETPTGRRLPLAVGPCTLAARRQGDTVWVTLSAAGHRTRLARLPEAARLTLGGAVLGPGRPPDLAVLPWRAGHGPIRVEGLAVLDLRRGRARLEVEAGLDAHLRRDFARARDHFAAAFRLDPTYANAAYDLACALVRLGRPARALPWLRRAFALAPHRLRRVAATDPDLAPLRRDPAFRRLAGPAPAGPSPSPAARKIE